MAQENCEFRHEGERAKKTEVCKFFKGGCCQRGAECLYSHNLRDEVCSHLRATGRCPYGDRCQFSHAIDVGAAAAAAAAAAVASPLATTTSTTSSNAGVLGLDPQQFSLRSLLLPTSSTTCSM